MDGGAGHDGLVHPNDGRGQVRWHDDRTDGADGRANVRGTAEGMRRANASRLLRLSRPVPRAVQRFEVRLQRRLVFRWFAVVLDGGEIVPFALAEPPPILGNRAGGTGAVYKPCSAADARC